MYPAIIIKPEMIEAAEKLVRAVTVKRTKASPMDTLTGILGEFVFADYFFGDWQSHRVGRNKGQCDFPGIEIKTSAFPFNPNLHLLIREDYHRRRKPLFYVQIILNISSTTLEAIPPLTPAILCGYATSDEIRQASPRDFGSKLGKKGGYRCLALPISQLHPIADLKYPLKITGKR